MRVETDEPAGDWTVPGVYEVAADTWRIPLPLPTDGLRAVNVYALRDGDGFVLVDSGWAIDEARDALAKALAALGAGLGDVRRFLVTHLHRDHYTLGVVLRREFGMPVALGLGEQLSLRAGGRSDASSWTAMRAQLHRAGADALGRHFATLTGGHDPEQSRSPTSGSRRPWRSRSATARCRPCTRRATRGAM